MLWSMDPQVTVHGDWVSTVVPLMKLLCLMVMGLLLANPRVQIVPRATFKLLSKLVFALFLPCLIFMHLSQSVTIDNVLHRWFIPVNVPISTAIGCFLGYIVALICCPPPQFFRFTVIMTGFGNTGNLPIAISGRSATLGITPLVLHATRRIWRLFTSFFFLGKFSINFGIRLLMIARYGVLLEKGAFEKRTTDFLWVMIFGAISLLRVSKFSDKYVRSRPVEVMFKLKR